MTNNARRSAVARVRRLVMDVDKALGAPDVVSIAAAIDTVEGVQAVNVTVTEIDVETIGMDVTVEGEDIDWCKVVTAIESEGAMVHSVDQVVVGSRTIENIRRTR